MSLILSISDALYDIDCDPTILFKNTDAWSLIRKTQSPAELKTFVENITDVVISYIESVQKQKAANIRTQVKALVEKNYARDASLETVASHVFISPCYLSVIFKKETNITFKNYTTTPAISASYFSVSVVKLHRSIERVTIHLCLKTYRKNTNYVQCH